MIRKLSVTVTTTTGGTTGTSYTPKVSGRIEAIQYVKSTYPDGVDITVTTEDTLQNVWVGTNVNAAITIRPRLDTQNADSGETDLTFDGTYKVCDKVCVANERIKVAIAEGGSAKSGTFNILIDTGEVE